LPLAVVVEFHLAAKHLAQGQADENRPFVDLGFKGDIENTALWRQELASDVHASNGPLGSLQHMPNR
jgi:hypothetical protein